MKKEDKLKLAQNPSSGGFCDSFKKDPKQHNFFNGSIEVNTRYFDASASI